ncbi:hypothetical protein CAC42_7811 [Sphaceloma murrayae]|uniref:Asl1-like glycosyl hydrolase catalytic domain-containing protein n=1 Tax=Sphaceloma murrayae TaxID=2082308 RepID=A0A2K1QXR2_9PEZI|nr:hypothetical protein CAC42_7811 [Sphaceloma murrayae]
MHLSSLVLGLSLLCGVSSNELGVTRRARRQNGMICGTAGYDRNTPMAYSSFPNVKTQAGVSRDDDDDDDDYQNHDDDDRNATDHNDHNHEIFYHEHTKYHHDVFHSTDNYNDDDLNVQSSEHDGHKYHVNDVKTSLNHELNNHNHELNNHNHELNNHNHELNNHNHHSHDFTNDHDIKHHDSDHNNVDHNNIDIHNIDNDNVDHNNDNERGKRGLAYNYTPVTNLFSSTCSATTAKSKVSWAYNWYSAPHDPKLGAQTAPLHSNLQFVPMLWSAASDLTSVWASNVAAAKSKGWTEVLGFNEPDLCVDGAGSSCMSIADAVIAYRQYITPLKAQGFRLGGPAVTNGQGFEVGNDWLVKFLAACSDCQIDFLPIHWYGGPTDFQSFYDNLYYTYSDVGKGKYPIWITEFGLTSGTDAQVDAFVTNVFAHLDTQATFVEKYAWFMAGNPGTYPGNLVSADQNSLSTIGKGYDTGY